MRARLSLAGFGIALALALIPTMSATAGAVQPSNVSMALDLCQRDGWQSLTNGQGQPFPNQGQCISYFIHNPVSLADLAGSFTGTTSFSFGTGSCAIEQVFDATYPGSSAVGSVTLHLDGCVNLVVPFTYAGTFAIATSVGTLSGNAAGPITNLPIIGPSPADFELTLTVRSGTGAFAGTTGTINVSIQWPGGTPVTGSVSVP